jgi:2-haloacid dehalogenase
MPLTDYKVLSLGCYGTLIDREAGVLAALRPLLAGLKLAPERAEILEAFARHQAAALARPGHTSYADVLADAHRTLAAEWGAQSSEAEHALFGRSTMHWPAYPDTTGALQYLRRYFRLVVLSNADHASLVTTTRRLGVRFDAVLSAEDVGAFKPNPRVFEALVGRLAGLGATPGQTLHADHDLLQTLGPAADAGLAGAWIHRDAPEVARGADVETAWRGCEYSFASLSALVRAHQDHLRA